MVTAAHIDLTADVDVTTALITDPLAWRVRVVEQIDIDNPHSALCRRSLQCAPLRPLLADLGALPRRAVDTALAVLPLCPMPKGPLLDFDVDGPGGSPAYLLQRADIAARETAVVEYLAAQAGLDLSPARVVVKAALGFTEGAWQTYRKDLDLVGYLTDGTGLPYGAAEIAQWLDLSERATALLAAYAPIPAAEDSAVLTPALVLPVLLGEQLVPSIGAATEALSAYLDLLTAADSDADDAAGDFLDALVDYGSSYDLLAVVRVPLDEPFSVKVVDRRPLRLSPVRNAGTHTVVLADARSNHVALRVTDPNVRLAGKVRAGAYGGSGAAYGSFTSRTTAEVHAFYAFERDRDYRIALHFRVAVLRRLQLVPCALGVLLLALAWAVHDRQPSAGEFALLVGPGALGASLLFARESSALASRLRRLSTMLVIVGMTAVFLVAAWQYRYG
jgi:hypothetical protein